MSKRQRITLAICTLLISATTLFSQEKRTFTDAEQLYDFGEIKEADGSVSHTFKIKNEKREPMRISQVTASCGCTTSQWPKTAIEEGATAEIIVTFNPKGFKERFEKSVVLHLEGADEPIHLTLTGNIVTAPESVTQATPEGEQEKKPIFSPDNTLHDFGQVRESDRYISHLFRIKNSGTAPLRIIGVQSSCGCLEPEWTEEPIPPGKEGIILMTYETINRPGPFLKNVSVYTNTEKRRHKLTIKGDVQPLEDVLKASFRHTVGEWLLLEERDIEFSTIRPQENYTKEQWIKNNAQATMTLQATNIPDYLRLELPAQLEPEEVARLKVTVDAKHINTKGRRAETFTLTTQTGTENPVKELISVPVNFIDDFSHMKATEKSQGGEIELSTTLLDFGVVKKGGFLGLGSKRASQQLSITNSGKRALTIHSISSDDPRIEITGFNRKVVEPNQTITVTAFIHPKTVKESLNTEIVIVSNDHRKPVRSVHVTGKRP